MLEALLGAALRTVLLALLVELCLRALRVRHPQLLLAAWTAVLAASLAMPMMQRYALITVPVAIDLPVSFADLPGGEVRPWLPPTRRRPRSRSMAERLGGSG